MPLRDHFRPPFDEIMSWDGFHGQWPAMIVLGLSGLLPERYVAAPHVYLGSSIEIDGVALAVATDLLDLDEYEVRIYDTRSGRNLVAAMEIVSPANKDRPDHRRVFLTKCAGLLQNHVSVTIIDLVTTRAANLARELLDLSGQSGPSPLENSSHLQASTFRAVRRRNEWMIETWLHPLELGQPLPTVPLWLNEQLAIPLDLEASYEATCRALRIR